MSREDSALGHLRHITSLLRARALEDMRRVQLEKDRLRVEQEEIDRMRDRARSAEPTLSVERRIGADMLWQGWLTSRRIEINRQMAMLRASEGHQIAVARAALARDEAVASLQTADRVARRSGHERRQDQALEALLFFRRLHGAEHGSAP